MNKNATTKANVLEPHVVMSFKPWYLPEDDKLLCILDMLHNDSADKWNLQRIGEFACCWRLPVQTQDGNRYIDFVCTEHYKESFLSIVFSKNGTLCTYKHGTLTIDPDLLSINNIDKIFQSLINTFLNDEPS